MGGLSNSINSYIKLDDIKNETIAYNDIIANIHMNYLVNFLFQIINLLKTLMKRNTDKINIMVVLCYVM